jgi:hypothetical protein
MIARSLCILVSLAVSILLDLPTRSHAQVVTFYNGVLVPYVTAGDVLIRDSQGALLTGTNYVAQLYYGPSAAALVAHSAAPARFRPPGSSLAGTWSTATGASRTLSGLSVGSVAVLAVRVWDISQAPTYEQAIAIGSFWSDNGPFYYQVTSGLDSTNYFMFNFRAIYHIGLRCYHVTNAPPSFDSQPQSLTVTRGQGVMLTATVTNACLGHWRFNGNFVGQGDHSPVPPGQGLFFYTRYTLPITNAQPSHAGSYQFIAENYAGSITSQVAVLTVVTPPQLTSARYDNGAFAFQVSEDTGRTVVIETASDLHPGTTWMPVLTNIAPFLFTNSAATDRQRFYRTVFR